MLRQTQISKYDREEIIYSLLDEITGVNVDSRPCCPEMLARMGKFFKQQKQSGCQFAAKPSRAAETRLFPLCERNSEPLSEFDDGCIDCAKRKLAGLPLMINHLEELP